MDISDIRKEYESTGLERKNLEEDPLIQFQKWFQQALDVDIEYPNGMTLATVGTDGAPTARTVLLKLFDRRGFVFYTNYESKKAIQIRENPRVALLFPWLDLQRQVKITGHAEKISVAESFKYFASRPRGSQLGAWCSAQSQSIGSRAILENSLARMAEKFGDGKIPLPDFWGGYRVVPNSFEFWQGRTNRLHDRFMYTPKGNDEWDIKRLAP
ncbi:MAG: pyridoxamine 5'-phosphate oxidase [Pseudomonadales bacterium]|jgi:pyridoxamine 5'-phosphate oxidase|nr:pyridoxamine 5'-phosphate oxidase [Pseudomonadales bacterium]MDP7360268.1 pyridoxamine 5'-phosphate oxidase [Pseudomonadales bacterium]MDP7597224.1 pyridoxamine 5'-phosphate oxidase [Pseudomonadales bacterium]HJN52400.1 pyridoxamine 5'-phosphate oxidase [Pseudomonadales bacterium]|tara:strand:+ start:1412 stop:2050 length:639 start_codon:yes stop_codon:yes gene_type:complete